jgi:hypothetical protein
MHLLLVMAECSPGAVATSVRRTGKLRSYWRAMLGTLQMILLKRSRFPLPGILLGNRLFSMFAEFMHKLVSCTKLTRFQMDAFPFMVKNAGLCDRVQLMPWCLELLTGQQIDSAFRL